MHNVLPVKVLARSHVLPARVLGSKLFLMVLARKQSLVRAAKVPVLDHAPLVKVIRRLTSANNRIKFLAYEYCSGMRGVSSRQIYETT